jgi:hypothetical protein
MSVLHYLRQGSIGFVATLAALTLTAAPLVAAPSVTASANAQPAATISSLLTTGAFKPIGSADPAARRAATALGLSHDAMSKAESGLSARNGAALTGVTCVVTGSPPRRADLGNTRINTTVTVHCNGSIKKITISIWLLQSLDNQSFTTLSNRLNEQSVANLFSVGTTGDILVCIPQYYIGLAHIWVEFLDGYPLEDGGWFGTDSVFIGCG